MVRSPLVALTLAGTFVYGLSAPVTTPSGRVVRVAAAQPKPRLIDYRVADTTVVLARVESAIGELERLIDEAAAAHCDALAFPEDTLGLGRWEAAHKDLCSVVLPRAVDLMLGRFGQAAAAHHLYLVCCNDTWQPQAGLRNTAFLLSPDGQIIGRYDKVNMPVI